MEREEILLKGLDAVLPHHRASVGISMGVGKTWLGLKHMESKLTVMSRFLVVAPKVSIYESWKEIAEKFDMAHILERVSFCTYLSLPKQELGYTWVYLDEMHSMLDSQRPWLEAYTGGILGLSGTPPKYAHSEKGKMMNEFCPLVFDYYTDEAINDNILNDYRIIVHPMKLSDKKTIWKTKKDGGGWWTSEKAEYDYWTKRVYGAISDKDAHISRVMRMKALMEFQTKLDYAAQLFKEIDEKVILFVDTQDQADQLCVHSYHSQNPASEENLEKFKRGEIMKLSCVLQLNEGVNIPGLKQAIIKHSYGNERKFAQRLGRMVRLNPTDMATMHVLCYVDTADEQWVTRALSDFDEDKIKWLDTK